MWVYSFPFQDYAGGLLLVLVLLLAGILLMVSTKHAR